MMMHLELSYAFTFITSIRLAWTLNIHGVKDVMLATANFSWEIGTTAEALLELDDPAYSVFGDLAFEDVSIGISSLLYAKDKISLDSRILYEDHASNADPASLGVAALMLGGSIIEYHEAATRQLETLLYSTPRSQEGTISHRSNSVQLWSDSIFMFPPFMAYYASIKQNETLLAEAVSQLGLYRDGLKQKNGAWAHISGQDAKDDFDPGQWTSGNAWAAYGMVRVLGAIEKGPWSVAVRTKYRRKVILWVQEIVDAAIDSGRDGNNLVRNYLDQKDTFGETSGTSLLAAAVFRMAVVAPEVFNRRYVSWAQTSYDSVFAHVGSDGIIGPAVNPYKHKSTTPYLQASPEGQAWAVMMYAARRDCITSASCQYLLAHDEL